MALVALAALSLTWSAGRRVPKEAAAWLGTAVILTSCLAWRAAEELRFFDVVAAMGVLVLAGNPGAVAHTAETAIPRPRDQLTTRELPDYMRARHLLGQKLRADDG